jgi:Fe-S-cluster-containing hydrogenase component 2
VYQVSRVEHTAGGPLSKLFAAARRWGQPVIPLEEAASTHRADKCDLCHGYDTLACVDACPNGALRLMAVEELLPL